MTESEPLDLDALQQEWEATTKGHWKVMHSVSMDQGRQPWVWFNPEQQLDETMRGSHFLTEDDAVWLTVAHEVYPRLIQRIKELEAVESRYQHEPD